MLNHWNTKKEEDTIKVHIKKLVTINIFLSINFTCKSCYNNEKSKGSNPTTDLSPLIRKRQCRLKKKKISDVSSTQTNLVNKYFMVHYLFKFYLHLWLGFLNLESIFLKIFHWLQVPLKLIYPILKLTLLIGKSVLTLQQVWDGWFHFLVGSLQRLKKEG